MKEEERQSIKYIVMSLNWNITVERDLIQEHLFEKNNIYLRLT